MAPGDDLDPFCHHKGRIEPDAELADQLVGKLLPLFRLAKRLDKGLRSGTRDRAKRLPHLIGRKTYAIVRDGQGLRLLVGGDGDLAIEGLAGIAGTEDGKLAFVDRVRCVGNQFTKEDLLLRIKRVDDDIQDLAGISLKSEYLVVHGVPPFEVLEAIWAFRHAISRRLAYARRYLDGRRRAKRICRPPPGGNSVL